MTQISRPFQIALLALGLFVAVWFVALRGHSTGGSGSSGSGSSAPATPSAAAPTPVYHGSAPGVGGLTRAISKAHGAVAQSQSDAKRVEHAGSSGSTAAGASSTVTVKQSVSHAGHTTVVHTTTVTHSSPRATKSAAAAAPAKQKIVERELHQHKTVLILFWNPHGSDDVAVHRELPAVQHALGGRVAVHSALPGQVGDFGTITHAIQVNQTPTLLIVGTGGQTTTITGLTDAFSIKQAIEEARRS